MGNRFEHLEFDEEPLRLEPEDALQQQFVGAGQQQQQRGELSAEAMDRHAYHQGPSRQPSGANSRRRCVITPGRWNSIGRTCPPGSGRCRCWSS